MRRPCTERGDIEEESVASDDEIRIEQNSSKVSGHGDQSPSSNSDDIEQLLHLLRVSLRVEQNDKTTHAINVSLKELAMRTRFISCVEHMLDSGTIFSQLALLITRD